MKTLSIRKFVAIATSLLVPSTLLGLAAGYLYAHSYLGDTGVWLEVLNVVTNWELDKKYLPYILSTAAYVTAWALFGGLKWLYRVGRLFLIKGFLGVAAVGAFFFSSGFQIPAFANLQPIALTGC
jgi:hypothetical protein